MSGIIIFLLIMAFVWFIVWLSERVDRPYSNLISYYKELEQFLDEHEASLARLEKHLTSRKITDSHKKALRIKHWKENWEGRLAALKAKYHDAIGEYI